MYICVYVYRCVCVCMYACKFVGMSVYTRTRLCTYVCEMYLCIYYALRI
jgi:hypothetical protein